VRNGTKRAEVEWSSFADGSCTTDALEGMVLIFMVVLKLRTIGHYDYKAK